MAAETSLAVPAENVAAAVDAVDEFIVDCKDMDREIYRRYTGGDGAQMENNLRTLLALAGPERVLVRVPGIPEYNDETDRARSAAVLRDMGVTRLDIFDYVRRVG